MEDIEEEKYCLIRQNEYDELRKKRNEFSELKEKYDILENLVNTEKKIVSENEIKIEFGVSVNNFKPGNPFTCRYENIGKKVINDMYCKIEPTTGKVDIVGGLRGKLHEVKGQVFEQMKEWIYCFLMKEINYKFERISELEDRISELEKRIKEHNSKWYNFHKIKI